MLHSTFQPFSTLPKAIQDRALAIFMTSLGMDLTEAVEQAEAEVKAERVADPRTKRAQAYLAKHGASFRQVKNGVMVPSESVPGTWYIVQGYRCSCPARGCCKHLDSVALWHQSKKRAA